MLSIIWYKTHTHSLSCSLCLLDIPPRARSPKSLIVIWVPKASTPKTLARTFPRKNYWGGGSMTSQSPFGSNPRGEEQRARVSNTTVAAAGSKNQRWSACPEQTARGKKKKTQ